MEENNILTLQREYLKTGSQLALANLYTELVKFSFYILKYHNYYRRAKPEIETIVYDVSSSIICRLIETQEEIIKSNPLGYLQSAILFSSKPNNKLEQLDVYNLTDNAALTEDTIINDIDESIMFETISNIIRTNLESIELKEDKIEVNQAVIFCLEGGKNYRKYIYKIKKQKNKISFIKIFEEIKHYLNQRRMEAQVS